MRLSLRRLLRAQPCRSRRYRHGIVRVAHYIIDRSLPRRSLSLRALTRYDIVSIGLGRRRFFEFNVVIGSRFGIGKHGVRLVDVRKLFRRRGVVGIDVGVVTLCQYAVTTLYFVVGRIHADF